MEIKEVKELVKGIELLAVTAAEVMADGKVDSTDLGSAINLLSKSGVIVEAVKGIKEIPAEIKDVDQAELIELGSMLYELIIKVKEAAEKE
jgi:hypothetical protein